MEVCGRRARHSVVTGGLQPLLTAEGWSTVLQQPEGVGSLRVESSEVHLHDC